MLDFWLTWLTWLTEYCLESTNGQFDLKGLVHGRGKDPTPASQRCRPVDASSPATHSVHEQTTQGHKKKEKKGVFKIASKNAAFERVVVRGQCGAGTKPVQSR
jgi:hypothetical protein